MKTLLIISCFILSVSPSFVIEPEKYMMKLYEQTADQLKSDPGIFKLETFIGDLDKTVMGKTFKGKVTFESGFVNRIGKFELNRQKNAEIWNSTLVRLFSCSINPTPPSNLSWNEMKAY